MQFSVHIIIIMNIHYLLIKKMWVWSLFPCVGCVQLASLMESLMKAEGHRFKSNFKAPLQCGQSALVCHLQYVPTPRPTAENWQTITYTNSLRSGSSNLSTY